jgi:peptidoglycan/xylan/chitin deacetylase (PgdA/CDA1 family)
LITSITFDDISPKYLSVDEFKNLIDFLDEVDINCTFFVVPYENLSCLSKRFSRCLRIALEKGHELALHGYIHVKNEFGVLYPVPLPVPFPSLKKQIERLKKALTFLANIVDERPFGFRAPLYLHNNATLKALSILGFRYDSSATLFKPAHNLHFRIKWLRVWRPFTKFGVVEIPVSGDYTYSLNSNNFNESLKIALRDFERVKSHDGVFVLNNHPKHFGNIGLRFLRILVESVSKKTVFLRLCDVAKIYKTHYINLDA